MLPLVSRIKLAIVIGTEALEEGRFVEVSRWLRLAARISDEVDDIVYEIKENKIDTTRQDEDGDNN